VEAVRARARLVLDRLHLVGEGAKQAQQRRSFLDQQSSKFPDFNGQIHNDGPS